MPELAVNLRRRLRPLLDRGAQWSGLLGRCHARMRDGVTLLMYHRVLAPADCRDYPLPSLVIPEPAFRAQIAWLARHAEVATLSGALERFAAVTAHAKPLVVVTFDDGYADNARIAAPILEEHGLRGTFYVTTGFVAERGPLWFDRASLALQRLDATAMQTLAREFASGASLANVAAWMAHAKQCAPDVRARLVARSEQLAGTANDAARFEPMTTTELRTLHERGHEIGSHTETHPLLPELDDAELARELAHSRRDLNSWTGAPVHGFCYPNGTYDDRVVRAVSAAGYAHACGTQSGINGPAADPLRLARVPITPDRVLDGSGRHDELGFAAEVCRVRAIFR